MTFSLQTGTRAHANFHAMDSFFTPVYFKGKTIAENETEARGPERSAEKALEFVRKHSGLQYITKKQMDDLGYTVGLTWNVGKRTVPGLPVPGPTPVEFEPLVRNGMYR